ncbi:two-component system, sensor histidine kinase YesM [Paenibacillus sp. 1_12]|uniref:sensor histidine kinase n=1 Tax=Paenibacillus sp. 1_12 TaxID=1566278 RepID=UPI0008F2EDCB|nr:sensor histidine kinase [Paenibacillus sp. 1_12]SFM17222.1 two-component system, sensor histidine kinase YesM [Paenibacillus sp. 1_12]
MSTRFFFKNLLLFLAPLLIPVVLLGGLSIYITQQYIQGEINRNNLVLFNQLDRNMEQIFSEMESLSVGLGNLDVLFRMEEILHTQTLTLEDIRLMKVIQNYLRAPASVKPFIESIYVYVNNSYNQFLDYNDGLIRLDDFHDSTWINSYMQNRDLTGIWTESRQIQHFSFEKPISVTTLYKNMFSSALNHPRGVIAINVYTQYIEKLLDQMATYPNQHIIVIDDNGRVIFRNHPDTGTNALNSTLIPEKSKPFIWKNGNSTYFVSEQRSTVSGWRYLSVTPQSSLNQIPFKLSTFTACIVLLSFVLGSALAYLLTKRSANQIRRIMTILQQAEKGVPLYDASASVVKDEYSIITEEIIKNFLERHYLQVQLSEKKYKLQAAELLALQAQINPHFLFNTLQTIYWKVLGLTVQPNEANQMLESLSGLLKYSLETPHEIVSLDKEIHNMQNYLDIQQIRYKDKFELYWQYEHEELEGVGIVKLLLQPLIENCIHHGLLAQGPPIQIKIKISRLASHLHIAVLDNGKGISRARLEEIRILINEEDNVYRHIGLSNTNKRIRLVYGKENGLIIRSKLSWGTSVSMDIPLLSTEVMERIQ